MQPTLLSAAFALLLATLPPGLPTASAQAPPRATVETLAADDLPAAFAPEAGNGPALPLYYGLPALRRPLPRVHYPERALQFRRAGRVLATFVVDERGRVEAAEIVDGFFRDCDDEVLRVLRRARFAPPRDAQGRAIRARFVAGFDFRLGDE